MQMWFNPRCSKCRVAKEALDEAGLTYDLRYYLEQPPSATELEDVLSRLGLQPWEICRTSDAANSGVTLPSARDDAHRGEWIDVLAAHPQLIQRPLVVTDDGTAYVARDADTVSALVKRAAER
ncbi:MAG TPA: ArsC/Spx/MgsR family protein [Mycobacteriales bacterium]|jgi:arsenate reductase|nr:ArsC/Spx/MgsR family protein [Mycobacteriales bacterium]